ncbi:1-deoxy-D-xylulose-5-phosphate synthase [Alicyclobacillus acidoterrestris]|uniref:1-deoxy-D-xylulose-5-phosphate synthase n=1 Tax=Alicyclobacillus acidoterrestris (strain ATCC 49025 / DSM 3922 / CIP 106132 / NCIMB 13137 / GD3B) TaxID=1356854 RepID=A0A9E6ZH16_ALIAG|nr:1-deoxy-D-xylulose-5-phosphate synthase [Alicyclobacillus acidoterrestris]
MTEEQLLTLAQEIRDFLVESISRTGGHFGASMGVVELTIALHRVFDSPTDKMIWDVGHQGYVHKLLTGRRDQFATLRKLGGMAGFLKRSESPHDVFGAGHSSTSISAALGMAVARDLSHEHYHVAAVIGDGALTGGMAMEAMNHAGDLGTDLLVVLNDNEMSISQNVGAISKYLTRLRSDPAYMRAKAEIDQTLRQLHTVGEKVTKMLDRVKDAARHVILPISVFECFGFKYLGPVDGHDLPQLISVLERAKELKGPVLVHTLTQKGKGYSAAENAPDKWHAWPSSNKAKKAPSYTNVFAETMMELAEQDERIVAVTPAMLSGSGLTTFQQRFPDRCFDVGIAEQHAATFCAGLAANGKKPVFAVYSTFLQRAYDQTIHDIGIQHLPVVLAVDRAGIVGPDGETHQGVFDLAYLRAIPGMTIMMPKDENELRHMLYTSIQWDGPVAVRYPRADGIGVQMDSDFKMIERGKAEIVRKGSDVTILALGTMVDTSLKAADVLKKEHGIDATVVNLRFVKPLDECLIKELAKTGAPVLTVEEAALAGGVGSAIVELLADSNIHTRVKRKGIQDEFIEHGSRDEVLSLLGLDVPGIVQDVLDLVGRRASASHILDEVGI